MADIFICCVDGLSGFAQALEAVYPQTRVQRCVVHLLRNSLSFVNWKERKQIADALKPVYRAPTAAAARAALDEFRAKYDARFPAIGRSWEVAWEQFVPYFDYPPEIRKLIYTTNAIESLNSALRRASRHRHPFPTLDSLYKLFYLALKRISAKWGRNVATNWHDALNRFIIEFGDRMPSTP